jgi:hypothetical protein
MPAFTISGGELMTPRPYLFPLILACSICGATLAWLITTVHGFILIPAAVAKIMGDIYNQGLGE